MIRKQVYKPNLTRTYINTIPLILKTSSKISTEGCENKNIQNTSTVNKQLFTRYLIPLQIPSTEFSIVTSNYILKYVTLSVSSSLNNWKRYSDISRVTKSFNSTYNLKSIYRDDTVLQFSPKTLQTFIFKNTGFNLLSSLR
jgi:hypothetical protein